MSTKRSREEASGRLASFWARERTRDAAERVGLKFSGAEVMDEAQAGEDEGRCAHELAPTRRGGVVSARNRQRRRWSRAAQHLLENEERVQGQHDRLAVLEVALGPPFLDEARAGGGVLDEARVQREAIVLEEVLDDLRRSLVLLGRLQARLPTSARRPIPAMCAFPRLPEPTTVAATATRPLPGVQLGPRHQNASPRDRRRSELLRHCEGCAVTRKAPRAHLEALECP